MRDKSLVPAQLPNTKLDILEFKYSNTSLWIIQYASNYPLITEYLRTAYSYRTSIENNLQPLIISVLDNLAQFG
jgi:hypothetical protein